MGEVVGAPFPSLASLGDCMAQASQAQHLFSPPPTSGDERGVRVVAWYVRGVRGIARREYKDVGAGRHSRQKDKEG